MKYTPSINIAQTIFDPNSYIVTQNAIKVIGNIVNSFNAGVHSFNIIGSYGTGKSNFILALEDSLKNNSKILITNKGQFNGFVRFRFEKIVGDYTSLQRVLTENLFPTEASDNLFENLKSYFKRAEKREEFVILVIDEFGKLLEYAAKITLKGSCTYFRSLRSSSMMNDAMPFYLQHYTRILIHILVH